MNETLDEKKMTKIITVEFQPEILEKYYGKFLSFHYIFNAFNVFYLDLNVIFDKYTQQSFNETFIFISFKDHRWCHHRQR